MTLLRRWRRLFGNRQLSTIEELMKKAISNQERLMHIMDEVKAAVADVAADALKMHDEIMVAIDHIIKEVDLDSNPDLKDAVVSLRDTHATLTDSLTKLKDKVDEVLASGGST
jgi:uncharacterized protein YpuA (DUF1002 family)